MICRRPLYHSNKLYGRSFCRLSYVMHVVSVVSLAWLMNSCGISKSVHHIPDVSAYSARVPDVKRINDSTFSFKENYLTKNKQQLWELYIKGNPLELGYNNGALTQPLMQKQEEIFFSRIEGFVPSTFRQKLLRGFLKWYNRKTVSYTHLTLPTKRIV